MASPSYDGILDLLQQGAVVEALEQFNAVHERALMLQQNGAQPHDPMRGMQAEPGSRGHLESDGVACYLVENGKKTGPYCQRCRDQKSNWVKLRALDAATYVCLACKSEYARHLCG